MPRADSRCWSDWTARDFSHLQHSGATTRAVPVQPEQHGPHLPVSVDATLLDGVVTACLSHPPADLIAPFLPTQVVGKSNEHMRCAGTFTLSADTLRCVWMVMGACAVRDLLGSNNRSAAPWQLAQMTARC
jgi:creatinine amidohydrolase